jgi:hypothetical protein
MVTFFASTGAPVGALFEKCPLPFAQSVKLLIDALISRDRHLLRAFTLVITADNQASERCGGGVAAGCACAAAWRQRPEHRVPSGLQVACHGQPLPPWMCAFSVCPIPATSSES